MATADDEDREPAVVGVDKHGDQPMASVVFASAELAEVVLADPPAAIGGRAVLPIKSHASDPTCIVLRWKGAPDDLSEETIAADFDAIVSEMLMQEPGDQVNVEEVGVESGEVAPLVAQVKKHRQQPMAYITFHREEVAQAVLAAPPASVGGFAALPVKPHQSDPASVVLRWQGPMEALSEDDIAADFNALFDLPPDSETPSMVTRVRKHQVQPMAYVTFLSYELAQAVLSAPPASIDDVEVWPVKPHQSDPASVVLRWNGAHADLGDEGIAAAFNAVLASLLESHFAEASSSGAPQGHSGGIQVKKHRERPIAFVNCPTPDVALQVLSNPPEAVCGMPVHEIKPHWTQTTTAVLHFESPIAELAEEAMSAEINALLAAGPHQQPRGGAASSARRVAPPTMQSASMVAQVKKHRQQPMAFVSFHALGAAQFVLAAPPAAVAGFTALPVKPHQTDPATVVVRWQGPHEEVTEEAIAAAFDALFAPAGARSEARSQGKQPVRVPAPPARRVAARAWSGGPMVVQVKKHWQQPMAYVAFSTPQEAQAVLVAPPASVGSYVALPVKPHQSDPNSVVLRWQGPLEDVTEDAIAAAFSAPVAQARSHHDSQPRKMGGKGAHVVTPRQALPAPLARDGPSMVAQVKKHRQQPMAYVTFHAAEAAQTALQAPPAAVGGFEALPVKPHQSDPNSVVLRWQGPLEEVSEEAIAAAFDALFAQAGAHHGGKSYEKGGKGAKVVSPRWLLPAPPARSASSAVTQVKKHRQQPMAYVTFSAPEVAQAVLAAPLAAVGGFAALPVKPHQSDPASVVLRWQGPLEGVTEEAIAAAFDEHLGAFSEGASAGIVAQIKRHQHLPMTYLFFHTAEQAQAMLAAPPASLGSVDLVELKPHWTQPECVVAHFAGSLQVDDATLVAEVESLFAGSVDGEGGQREAPRRQALPLFNPQDNDASLEGPEGGSVVVNVKKHREKPMAFVTFLSSEIAQAVLAAPPEVVGGFAALPVKPHQSDPASVVLRWQGGVEAVSEIAIAEAFDALFLQAADLAQPVVVTNVKRHQQKPMAYVSFSTPEAAQALLEQPPQSLGGGTVHEIKPHWTQPSCVVIHFEGSMDGIADEAIAADAEGLFVLGEGAPADEVGQRQKRPMAAGIGGSPKRPRLALHT